MSALIQVTLPHSLTSSQGQSEDQFLERSPAPPLAAAPVWIPGSWPLPPPPGQCWYGCGYEQLLVGQLEKMIEETLLLCDCCIQKTKNDDICCCCKPLNVTGFRLDIQVLCVTKQPSLFVKMNSRESRLSSFTSHQCVITAIHKYQLIQFYFQPKVTKTVTSYTGKMSKLPVECFLILVICSLTLV